MPEITESLELERKSMLRDLDIPGVKDRNPDPTAGPRLAIREFRVQGLVEYPELGITTKAINELVEKIRFDLMAEDKLLESGYTLEELGGLSDLLVEIEEDTVKRHVTPIEVQKLVWLIRDQRKKRGITLGQIESIADKITKFYRERGFILAKAYIPKQEVRDGIVTLTLLLGMLGSVDVNNNKLYDASTIKSVFDDMLTNPVTNAAVEENLYLINDFPGVSVNGYFEPGYQVGDTKLTINVKNEEKFNSNIRLDNHGTDSTGKYRSYVDLQVNNLIGNADLVNLSLLNASEPNNTRYYLALYETTLFSPRFKLAISTSKNQFLVDKQNLGASVDIHGDVEIDDISARYQLTRSRVKNTSLSLKYESIFSDLQLGNFPDFGTLDDKLKNTSLTYNFDYLDEKARTLHQGNYKYTSGEFVFGAEAGQSNTYRFINADYTMLTFVKVPFTESNSRLILRLNAQYSGEALPTVTRASLAGPTKARGYSSDVFSGDDAIFVGLDWVFNSPDIFDFQLFDLGSFKDLAKPFVFFDTAYGRQYSIDTTKPVVTSELVNIGMGLQFAYKDSFSGNLQIAFPVFDEFSDPNIGVEKENSRIVFDFQYRF